MLNSTSTILQLLELSRQNQADTDIVHAHIRSILAAQEAEHARQHQAYCDFFSELTAYYCDLAGGDSPLQQHLALLKLRLDTKPGVAELNEIRFFFADLVGASQHQATQSDRPESTPETVATDSFHDDEVQELTHSGYQPVEPVPPSSLNMTPQSGDELLLLDEKRKRMEEIQASLSLHLSEVAEQNKALGQALKSERNNINSSNNDNSEELKTLKSELSDEISQLLQGHQALTEKLDKANQFMQIIESEGQHLNDELKKAHTLSLTDELTQLPNRRAFFKRIEDEVSRVQRYEYPLCLALIDLDSFKAINDRYGHNAGDEVLRSFAERALSGFRHHDLASRYGGEEFAIILPNTDISGAQRALEKVRGRTSHCVFQFNGITHPIPTFSAGISLYVPGDTPVTLIERADQALYRAKRRGRNRIEVAESKPRGDTVEPSSRRSS